MSDEVKNRLQELQRALAPKPVPRAPRPPQQPATPAPAQSSGTGRFACPACPDRFPSLGDKKRHMRAAHP